MTTTWNADLIRRAPVEWPPEPEPTTVRRWPVQLRPAEPGYHHAEYGGRMFVPVAVILRREAHR